MSQSITGNLLTTCEIASGEAVGVQYQVVASVPNGHSPAEKLYALWKGPMKTTLDPNPGRLCQMKSIAHRCLVSILSAECLNCMSITN